MLALGLIETKGLLAAIEGADAMLKAADVRLLEKNLAGGGLVTVSVAGEVAAVQAAVDAGVASIARIAGTTLISRHVIPRPDEELTRIVATVPGAPVKVPAPPERSAASRAADLPESQLSDRPAKPEAPASYTLAQLKKMSLNRMRQAARGLPGIGLSPEAVEAADKQSLIHAIMNVCRHTEE